MKKSLIALAVAVLCAVPVAARAQGGLGVLGGLSYASEPNGITPGGTLKPHSGFAVGVAAEGGGAVTFGINALYAQRGYTASSPITSQRYDYIDVPVYLKVNFQTPSIAPFVFIGPQGSFELQCDGGDCPSGRPKVTYSGIVGAGLRFPTMGGVSIQGRYVYGLSNLDINTVTNRTNYQQRSFMLLLGIGF
jgi:hypothetical protein